MKQDNIISAKISGYVVGPIWWPVGAECFKRFDYDLIRESGRYSAPDDLTIRDHVLAITNDGDFQHATIAHGDLTITRQIGKTRVTTDIPLEKFGSAVADCLHPEGRDWCPQYDGEDE